MYFDRNLSSLHSEPLRSAPPAEKAQEDKTSADKARQCVEGRFTRAKEALMQAQQQKCEALYEFLQTRAELSTLLEAAFPSPETEH